LQPRLPRGAEIDDEDIASGSSLDAGDAIRWTAIALIVVVRRA
jgi:hypothetical protein